MHGCSYVCDVNGFSFVKNSRKYYDDCSRVLYELMLTALRPDVHQRLSAVFPLMRVDKDGLKVQRRDNEGSVPSLKPSKSSESLQSTSQHQSVMGGVDTIDSSRRSPNIDDGSMDSMILPPPLPREDEEELRCVIAVIRHGDRTPKQKMKLKVSFEQYLNFYSRHASNCKSNIKVKSRASLVNFLELTSEILAAGPEISNTDETEVYRKLHHIKDVLERWEISGINRKLQMKPLKWEDVEVTDADGLPCTTTKAVELLLILKWGGDLTPLGRNQSERMGADFRSEMYPDASGGGILRLHSTFRHDLKIKSSDEGRVMKTAAAFTKGLLELEGQLTPVLVSLVTVEEKYSQMLDHAGNNEVKEDVDRCKEYLNTVLQRDIDVTEENVDEIAPHFRDSVRRAFLLIGNPKQTLHKIHSLIETLTQRIDAYCVLLEKKETLVPQLYVSETFYLMQERWSKLYKDFYKSSTDCFDLTKVPEIYDMSRYDVLHNSHLGIECLDELYRLSKVFADCVVPQEYGIDVKDKRVIGSKMCHALLDKIRYDLNVARSGSQMDMRYLLDISHADDLNIKSLGRSVRTRLYFTSESHLYTMINVLRYPQSGEPCAFDEEGCKLLGEVDELSYLSRITIRLFDRCEKDIDDPEKYRCEIAFSAGATNDATTDKTSDLSPLVLMNKSISCDQLLRCLENAIDAGQVPSDFQFAEDSFIATPAFDAEEPLEPAPAVSTPPSSPIIGGQRPSLRSPERGKRFNNCCSNKHASSDSLTHLPIDALDKWERET